MRDRGAAGHRFVGLSRTGSTPTIQRDRVAYCASGFSMSFTAL